MKKFLAILLCAIFAFTTLCACESDKKSKDDDDKDESVESSEASETSSNNDGGFGFIDSSDIPETSSDSNNDSDKNNIDNNENNSNAINNDNNNNSVSNILSGTYSATVISKGTISKISVEFNGAKYTATSYENGEILSVVTGTYNLNGSSILCYDDEGDHGVLPYDIKKDTFTDEDGVVFTKDNDSVFIFGVYHGMAWMNSELFEVTLRFTLKDCVINYHNDEEDFTIPCTYDFDGTNLVLYSEDGRTEYCSYDAEEHKITDDSGNAYNLNPYAN